MENDRRVVAGPPAAVPAAAAGGAAGGDDGLLALLAVPEDLVRGRAVEAEPGEIGVRKNDGTACADSSYTMARL